MREWGAEALTALIKAGLAYKHDPPLAQNQVDNSTPKQCGAQTNTNIFSVTSLLLALLYHMNIVGSILLDVCIVCLLCVSPLISFVCNAGI